jgi:hypothetical protein
MNKKKNKATWLARSVKRSVHSGLHVLPLGLVVVHLLGQFSHALLQVVKLLESFRATESMQLTLLVLVKLQRVRKRTRTRDRRRRRWRIRHAKGERFVRSQKVLCTSVHNRRLTVKRILVVRRDRVGLDLLLLNLLDGLFFLLLLRAQDSRRGNRRRWRENGRSGRKRRRRRSGKGWEVKFVSQRSRISNSKRQGLLQRQ